MLSEEKISRIIVRLTIIFWMSMKILSVKLWLTDRNYPLVPLIDLPSALHTLLYISYFIWAVWLLIFPSNRYLMWIIIANEILSSFADQSRFQPWEYQYLFTLFVIAAHYRHKAKAIQAIILMLAATYIYSGIQKINSGFIDFIWSFHILKRFAHIPEHIILNKFVQLAGYALPAIEITGGIFLLFHKTMKWGVWILTGMHIFILWFMGPWGINYNNVVWPWNVQMFLLLYLIFIKEKIAWQPSLFWSKANYITALCWIVLPFAGLFGYWDKFLSAGMYSGRGNLMQFYFEDRKIIPEELRKYAFYSQTDSSARIVVTDWCIRELNVASVTEPRVLNSIVEQLNQRYKEKQIRFALTPARRRKLSY